MISEKTIDRWATYIIPAVFKGEDDLLTARPEWAERLKNVTPENRAEVAAEYCRAIAEQIVLNSNVSEEDND